ncbi:MAG: GGDEF domain-containing protein [Xanthomonadales bacterium]|nr:GGDEF domain-containing protein [Xanthomonadales bacterium]
MSDRYATRFVLVAATAMALPVSAAIVMAFLSVQPIPLAAGTLGAAFAGAFLARVLIRSLLSPVERTVQAMEKFADTRQVPELEVTGNELPARLAASARKGMVMLHENIRRREFDHTTDPLTGLINQRSAIRRLGSDILRSQRDDRPVCVGLVEVDNMQWLANQFGHDSVDTIVKTVSKVIVESLRRSDWVASYGNNEFLVGLWGVDEQAAKTAFDRVNEILGNNPNYPVSLSVGVARSRPDSNPDNLIANATNAMYEARKAGGRQIVIDGC